MDEVSVEAKLASEGVAPSLMVAVPRVEVQRVVDEEHEADLVLDVVRTNGQREERRVLVALDVETLRSLITGQEGEQILFAIDPESLAATFDDVEGHGLREAGATFAVVIAAFSGGAGVASAAVDQGGVQDDPPIVQAGMPRAMPSDYDQARADEAQMPRAMPSDYQAAGVATSDIEQIRAAQPAPDEGPLPSGHIVSATVDRSFDAVENVRGGGPAVPDPSTAIENVRADRTPVEVGDGGTTIAAPSTGAAVAIAGGALLMIAAAAFAVRRTREPRPA